MYRCEHGYLDGDGCAVCDPIDRAEHEALKERVAELATENETLRADILRLLDPSSPRITFPDDYKPPVCVYCEQVTPRVGRKHWYPTPGRLLCLAAEPSRTSDLVEELTAAYERIARLEAAAVPQSSTDR